ncbi:MAG: hypothetical protein V4609_10840 [Pseudomonadota bacterium]
MNQGNSVSGAGKPAQRPARLHQPASSTAPGVTVQPRTVTHKGRTVTIAKASGLQVLPQRPSYVPLMRLPPLRAGGDPPVSVPGVLTLDSKTHALPAESKAASEPDVAGGRPAKQAPSQPRPASSLPDARAQEFLLNRGIDKLSADNCGAMFRDIFQRTSTRLEPRGDLKAHSWPFRTEDVARCLALHMPTMQPPIPHWEGALVSALAARQIDRPSHSDHRSFLAGIRGLAAALEPQRGNASPALLARVFRQVLQPALPADLAQRYATRATAQRLIVALLSELAAAPPASTSLEPGDAFFWFGTLRQGAARSPVELGEIVRNLVRAILPATGGALNLPAMLMLLTLRDTLVRLEPRFTRMQMTALGCGYAVGLANTGAAARPWTEVAARVAQLCAPVGDVMSPYLALGMHMGANPMHALAHMQLTIDERTDLVRLALDLGRVPDRSEALALVLKLKIADTAAAADMPPREARLRAECMTRIVESGTEPIELSSLIETCAFTRRALTAVVDAAARRHGKPAADAKVAAAIFETWLPGSFGVEALHLHRLLCRQYDLANERLARPTTSVRRPFGRLEAEALASFPQRLRQPLLERLKPLETSSGPAEPPAPGADHK